MSEGSRYDFIEDYDPLADDETWQQWHEEREREAREAIDTDPQFAEVTQ